MNDVEIYILKSGFQERIDRYFDESYEASSDDEKASKRTIKCHGY